ncbi:MAG: TerB family tellurite resistance protein [Rhodospirillales bacterium]|nr:TerB family tellurite resistance protein [Rhodospirillales bacterium]MCB9995317.1 TerB family tellurite resistance protein [Rhodospirillales bacterium]
MDHPISESRFNMWRAVFAMAHADHVVTAEERAFMENYLNRVAFSEEQRAVLRQDMIEAQDIYELFAEISDAEDRGAFFQFARELCWCDGDFDAQEEMIKERLKTEVMGGMNLTRIDLELKKSRAEMKMERTAEDRAHKRQAGDAIGLRAFVKGLIGKRERR